MREAVEHGDASRRGIRAGALAVMLAVLMAFGWSARQAMDGFGHGLASSRPGGVAAVEISDGVGADGLGSLLHAVKPPLDQFDLPRPMEVETSRKALSAPPTPEPVKLLPIDVADAPEWVRSATFALRAERPLAPATGWESPRTPTGPPVA